MIIDQIDTIRRCVTAYAGTSNAQTAESLRSSADRLLNQAWPANVAAALSAARASVQLRKPEQALESIDKAVAVVA